MLFCEIERSALKDKRDELMRQNPGSEQAEALSNITKALGQKWKSLTDNERAHYQELFHEKVEQYNADLQEYQSHVDIKVETPSMQDIAPGY
jgi:ABC-type transporter MlaC component